MNDTAPWQALGTELAAARHRRALSQQQLAHQLGISQAAASMFERGVIRPRPALLGRLAAALGADVTHLAPLADYPLEQVLIATARIGWAGTNDATADRVHHEGGAPRFSGSLAR